jgi:hypothetical protein
MPPPLAMEASAWASRSRCSCVYGSSSGGGVEKRQKNRIGAKIVHISHGGRNLVSRKLVNQLMKFLLTVVKVASHIGFHS